MRHRFPLGSLDLPEGFEDRSSHQFLAPLDPELEAPLAKGRGGTAQGTRWSVLVTRAPLESGMNGASALRAQEEALKLTVPRFHLLSRDPWAHPAFGSVPSIEVTFEVGAQQLVWQSYHAFERRSSSDVVCVSFTCEARAVKKHAAEMKRVFAAFELAA